MLSGKARLGIRAPLSTEIRGSDVQGARVHAPAIRRQRLRRSKPTLALTPLWEFSCGRDADRRQYPQASVKFVRMDNCPNKSGGLTYGVVLIALAVLLTAPQEVPFAGWPTSRAIVAEPGEGHLRNIRQLTFGGQNAEAYWSNDGKMLTFQSLQPQFPDEQIFTMRLDGSEKMLRSNGLGRCTCSYFTPDGKWIYFSSTFEKNAGPQAKVDMSQGYVWRVNPDFAMYRVPVARPGAKPELVFQRDGYVAETTIDPNGRYLTFTSDFEGDLEIYRADLNGRNVRRLTNEPGYDGGPFISWDGKKIVYRRDTISSAADLATYKELLSQCARPSSKFGSWTPTGRTSVRSRASGRPHSRRSSPLIIGG
ncbi:MAG: hypothetical protein C4320_07515 [Armatimonadota bacterium]